MNNFMYYVGYFLGGALIIVPIVVFLILLIFIPLFLYKKYKGKQPGTVEPEVQKYKTKKKLKILVAALLVLLLSSVALNVYMIYEPDKYVFFSRKTDLYHDQNCEDAHGLSAMQKSKAIEQGYEPCPKCDP